MRILISLLLVLKAYVSKCAVYDYIIVGSGPAGAVLAYRLSNHPDVTVLLLEAGERCNLVSEVPTLYPYLQGTSCDWDYNVSFPTYYIPKAFKKNPAHMPSGKALGGSSIINSMLYVRGNRKDYDNWESNGVCGWKWDEVLGYFLKSEKNMDPDIANNGYHGTAGKMFVQRPAFATFLKDKYLQAAQELGFKIGDVNGFNQSVFTNPQTTCKDGRRWGVDKSFLNYHVGRNNLKILTSALATKVIIEGNMAKGVEYEYKGVIHTVYAREEVILSAGAVRSPQLLMLSGIGPPSHLKDFQISPILNLPVGKNLQDHPVVSSFLYKISNLTVSEKDYKEYLQHGNGIFASVPTEGLGYFNTIYNEDHDWPDAEIVLVTLPSSIFSTWDQGRATVICASIGTRPKSLGRIRLQSKNPRISPVIEGNYLKKESDINVMVEALKMCLKFADTKALRGIGERIPPLSDPICNKFRAGSDDYYKCLVTKYAGPGFHLVGSCKMGHPLDNSTVVNFDLKVKGIERLRVADASVAPQMITGHPYAMAVMIGEKAAQMILKDYNERVG